MTENFENYFIDGISSFKKRDYQNAIAAFQKAKTIKPDHSNVQFHLGKSYSNIKEIRKAIQAFTVGLLLSPKDIDIHNSLTEVLSNYFFSDKEERELREKILSEPDSFDHYFGLANTLLGRTDTLSLEESIELFETIVRLYPDFMDAYMLLGLAYSAAGMNDKSIEIDERAVRINPNFDEVENVFYHLDIEYKLRGNFPEMIVKYRTLLREEKNKNDLSYHYALAEAYLNNGDLLSAKEEYELISRASLYNIQFFQRKIKEIDKKIEKIRKTEEKVKKFERDIRKFIEEIFLINNRNFYHAMKKSESFDKVHENIQTEINKKPYLTEKGLNPLEYSTIFQYKKLIEMNWDIFEDVFQSKQILGQHFQFINDFRNQVAHNRIVDDDTTIDFCNGSLSWFNKILEKQKTK